MIQRFIFLSFLFATFLWPIFSCQRKNDFNKEIKTLDSLILNSTLKADSIKYFVSFSSDTINSQLQYIQSNYVGKMKQSMAVVLSEYSLLKSKKITSENWRDSLIFRFNKSNESCRVLKQGLLEHATHDSKNTPITEQYIARSIQSESAILEDLHVKSNDWRIEHATLKHDFDIYYPQIKHWVDSIPSR